MKNKNFEHINYIINQNISQINDYIKQNTKTKKPIDPESDKDLAFRLNFKYNIGDYAWYIPEKIDNVQPFIAIRCIIVDACKDSEVTEYAIDESVKHTISPLKLYPDVTLCFNALERTFYNSIKEYIKDYRRIIVVSNERLTDIEGVEWFDENGNLLDKGTGEYNKHGNDSWA